jgi:hypothetical protein
VFNQVQTEEAKGNNREGGVDRHRQTGFDPVWSTFLR